MDGILNINKPAGKTSFDIVAQVKRLSGEKRVGHAGTLDPIATGVLPVCLGRATRIVQYLADATKTYRAEIELGVTTDTYDVSGRVTHRSDPLGISREQVAAALASFCGSIQQTPPMYSAVKHQGKPLYELARAGIEVERKSRLVKIFRIELLEWQPPLVTVELECGKGTYIRSLAHDLGQVLGCGANLKNLIRLRCGVFDIKDALSLPQLEEAFQCGYWQRFVYPVDIALLNWSAMVVSRETEVALRNGRPLDLTAGPVASPGDCCRVYTLDGFFLGVLRFNPETRQWQPEKIFL